MMGDEVGRWPWWTAEWPGVGGRIREQPEDFFVEEIPAYQPCGQGEHLYLQIEKRNVSAEYLLRRLSQQLGIPATGLGVAGLKDRHAVTRQWISVPQECGSRLDRLVSLEAEGIRLLQVSRHRNKLRPGHVRANRFRILIRGADATAPWQAILHKLQQLGLPNYYGPQRFGHHGSTLALGWQCLHRQVSRSQVRPWQFRLALSAVQAHLFNVYLARRQQEGLLRRVLEGDVLVHWPVGGLFRAQDVDAEQARLEARQVVPAGPMFGTRLYPAAGVAAQREAAVLHRFGLSPASFAGFGKLLTGTRRRCLIYVDDLHAHWQAEGLWLQFTLPAGSYATVLLAEVMKTETTWLTETASDLDGDNATLPTMEELSVEQRRDPEG
ncbi:MAG: tRNA pseudouridine(13) synthase TruD [Gemmataceae bacterium]|nr:tRNA pseudouridine(13) synthase TruD [Gemmataceae bacterium]MCS7270968.1 tRNA pseudouridine(13) synthase TruD [Gemmataceae bacterium]MDW8243861.1 tRNA pseudouridine(13) synthase TruD [Thermogemmata sp.]